MVFGGAAVLNRFNPPPAKPWNCSTSLDFCDNEFAAKWKHTAKVPREVGKDCERSSPAPVGRRVVLSKAGSMERFFDFA